MKQFPASASSRPYDRGRIPAPMLPHRVPSGRRAVEQPNACGDGETRLTARCWLAIGVTGVMAGLLGALMVAILHGAQRLAYGDRPVPLANVVASTDPGRRIVVLAVAGFLTGVGWWLLGRYLPGGCDVDDAIWSGVGNVAFGRSLGTGALSEVAVGAGASLGQEAAPKLLGSASGALLVRVFKLDAQQRRLLVACGAGAGMGAVYNVPLGGALVTAELLLGSLTLPVVLPAMLCACVATVTTWLFLPNRPTYDGLPHLQSSPLMVVWACLAGVLFGIAAVALVRAVGWVSYARLSGGRGMIATPLTFALLGIVAIDRPALLGNGRAVAEMGFTASARIPVLTLMLLVLLKPLLTLACLWSGASGGLFTPVMCTGAALGLLGGEIWQSVGGDPQLAICAVVGAAALSGATMQAPLAASVLVIELTGNTQGLLLPVVLATALATTVARYLDGYSVFSARLPARPLSMVRP